MSDIQDIVDALKGVARDIRNEVLAIDTDIDLDGYVETMIDAPVIRALAARGLGDDDAARLRLEVAMRDLLMDFDAEVLTSNDAEFNTAEYADTMLRPLLTTTCGLAA